MNLHHEVAELDAAMLLLSASQQKVRIAIAEVAQSIEKAVGDVAGNSDSDELTLATAPGIIDAESRVFISSEKLYLDVHGDGSKQVQLSDIADLESKDQDLMESSIFIAMMRNGLIARLAELLNKESERILPLVQALPRIVEWLDER